MGFIGNLFHIFSKDKEKETTISQNENIEVKEPSEFLNDIIDPENNHGNVNIIDNNGNVEGRYVEDLREPTEEEQFQRDQRRMMNELRKVYISDYAVCSVAECPRKTDSPLFIGQDGRYYCRDHILPENSGRIATGQPPLDGILSYRSDGKILFKK